MWCRYGSDRSGKARGAPPRWSIASLRRVRNRRGVGRLSGPTTSPNVGSSTGAPKPRPALSKASESDNA
eukprot:6415064-Pyramimonas_sp.AAC.1